MPFLKRRVGLYPLPLFLKASQVAGDAQDISVDHSKQTRIADKSILQDHRTHMSRRLSEQSQTIPVYREFFSTSPSFTSKKTFSTSPMKVRYSLGSRAIAKSPFLHMVFGVKPAEFDSFSFEDLLDLAGIHFGKRPNLHFRFRQQS